LSIFCNRSPQRREACPEVSKRDSKTRKESSLKDTTFATLGVLCVFAVHTQLYHAAIVSALTQKVNNGSETKPWACETDYPARRVSGPPGLCYGRWGPQGGDTKAVSATAKNQQIIGMDFAYHSTHMKVENAAKCGQLPKRMRRTKRRKRVTMNREGWTKNTMKLKTQNCKTE